MALLDRKCCINIIDCNGNTESFSTHQESSDDLNKMAVSIFDKILDGWMYGYGKGYTKGDYLGLFSQIRDLVFKQLPLRFLLPAFPCKTANHDAKVLGPFPDFAEFLAIRTLATTVRKLQEIYPVGVIVTIMSDYHTFDEYIGVSEEHYKVYYEGLKQMIHDAGADDIIKLISLSNFPEFRDVPECEISRKLNQEYGDPFFSNKLEKSLKENPEVLEKYLGLKKFMLQDQSHNLPGSPRSNKTKSFIQKNVRGMMSQGVALDKFLKKQNYLKNYIRLSIHDHHPRKGKFAVDLFKHETYQSRGVLCTPWHNTILFDSLTGEFVIDHKANILANYDNKQSFLVKVHYGDIDWFYLRLYFSDEYAFLANNEEVCFEVKMVKQGCGITITYKSPNGPIKSDCLDAQSLTNLIKEFGVVVLRGFEHFNDEKEIIDIYSKRATHGIINWSFGMIHKVATNDDLAGIVNSKSALNIHFDLTLPPQYMGISQSKHKYEEYVPREFLLYCRQSDLKGKEGATTFTDGHGAVLSLPGAIYTRLKNTVVAYQTELVRDEGKELYFGGQSNIYEYPLVHLCPWTGKDVLRWQQSWREQEHPGGSHDFWLDVKNYPGNEKPKPEDVDHEMRKIVFDERFCFEHSYEEGDQVYVNNYTMLHGRKSFSNSRELWRLQAIPPNENLPRYFGSRSSY